jgi:exopolysaccharide production protein ExoZ
MGIHVDIAAPGAARAAPVGFAPAPAPAVLPQMLGIQYLRGAAALGVVVFHASQAAGFPIEAGAFGVDVFFVLSGFLMMAITTGATRPWPFLRDRALRIVPLYWIASVAALCLGAAGIFWTPSRLQALASFAFIPYGPESGAPYYYPVLTIGWTLNYEMFFYCVFAASLFLKRSARLPALTALFGALVALRYLLAPAAAPLLFWSDPLILEFLAGAWVGATWRRGGLHRQGRAWALAGAAVLAFLLVRQPLPPLPLLDSRLPNCLPAVLALLAMLEWERQPGGVPYRRLPALIGDASYSIYLWHVFAIGAAVLIARALALPAWTIFPLGGAGGFLLGLAAYRLIEAPLLAHFRTRRAAR